MDASLLESLGDELYAALVERRTVAPLGARGLGLGVDDAYHVSRRILERRLAAGATIVGKKIGVTSAPVQKMLGVFQPDFGWLTDDMRYAEGEVVPIGAKLVQPRAEAEIAFVLERRLAGPGVSTADVLAATAYVSPCFEIVDSRIEGWKIAIEDTVADNASSGLFLVGDAKADARKASFDDALVRVEKNGALLSEGRARAAFALGSPAECVAWLANTLGRFGVALEPGEIVLSGSLVPLEPVVPGDRMSLAIEGLGSAELELG